MPGAGAWPTELRVRKDRKSLLISFDDGESYELAAEYLRVRSPSAEVQGHSPSERRVVAGKLDVQILELHPVGNYAVQLAKWAGATVIATVSSAALTNVRLA